MSNAKDIWLVSKYAVLPRYGPPNRQYFITKFLNSQYASTQLITSRSCAYARLPRFNGLYESSVDQDQVPYVILNGPSIGLGFSAKRLVSWLIFELNFFIYSIFHYKSKPKVLYISSLSILTFLTGVVLKKIFKCKLVLEVRDIWPATLVAFSGYKENNPIIKVLKWVEKFGYCHADLIVGSMPRLDAHIKQVIKKDFRFLCVPMGYDEDFYRLDFTALNRDQNIYDKLEEIKKLKSRYRFTVAYAGTLGKANYVDEILKAAKLLGKEFGVFIIGDGPLKDKLQHEFASANIHFLGNLKKTYLPRALNEFDLLVNMWGKKAIYAYGVSPNKWIDYMLSERPILVTFDGYRSIINEAECGWFIPANNPTLIAEKIVEIAGTVSPATLNEMGKRGSEFVKNKLNYSILANRLFLEIGQL